jgi:hypothetical protein
MCRVVKTDVYPIQWKGLMMIWNDSCKDGNVSSVGKMKAQAVKINSLQTMKIHRATLIGKGT